MKFFHLRRFRLALTASAVFGAILAALFLSGLWIIRRQEILYLTHHLRRATLSALDELHDHPRKPEINEVLESFPNVSITFYDEKNRILSSAGIIRNLPPDSVDGLQYIGIQKAVVFNSGRHDDGRVVVAELWQEREEFIHRIAWFFAAIFFPLVAAGGAATYLSAKRTFTPLDRLARQAEEMSSVNRNQILEVQGQDEFAEFADRLNRFIGRIRASVEAQERFVADAAHELRTPLTVMRGEIETTLLRERKVSDYQAALKTVLDESERLSRLVDLLLLSASNVEEGALPISLEQACLNAEAKWIDRFTHRGVRIEMETEPVFASILPEEIDSILDNLFSNCLRYAPPKTSVFVRLKVRGKEAIIDCIDEGPGIPDELREKIFDRFARADQSRNRELGGFGIGLAVCRRLVEARHGSIRALKTKKGAHFQVILPAVDEA